MSALAVAALSSSAAFGADGTFSKADGADENVLRAVRLLDASGFSRVSFKDAALADGGHTVRLSGVTARGLENYNFAASAVTVSGLVRSGSRISADAMTFKDSVFKRYDDKGISISTEAIAFSGPETLVTEGTPARLRFSGFSVNKSKFVSGDKVVASVKDANLEASDWMPGGEVARKMKGRLAGSVSPAIIGLALPFGFSPDDGPDLQVSVSGSTEIGSNETVSSTVSFSTNGSGNYEIRLVAAGVSPDAFSAIREVEEVTRYSGSAKPAGVVNRLLMAEDSVKIGLVSIQADNMEWVGPALEKLAKKKRKTRAQVSKDIVESLGGWIEMVASAETTTQSKAEIAKFLADPHRITFRMAPAEPTHLQKNWFLSVVGLRLDNFGFSVKAN